MTIAAVEPSLSPSMDIQVASNFERLLFELKGRNGAAVARGDRARSAATGALPADDQAVAARRAKSVRRRTGSTMPARSRDDRRHLSRAPAC